MQILPDILSAVGNTPLIRLRHFGADLGFEILAKAEHLNPGGSVKDRAALAVVEDAEGRGLLRPGSTVVEWTSGNLGTGLALACAAKGYRFVAVMSQGACPHRARHMQALGAEVVLVPKAPGSLPGAVGRDDLACLEQRTVQIAAERKAWRPDLFRNRAPVDYHDQTTGEEIWNQAGEEIDAFCSVVGTGATFVGVARKLKWLDATIRCFAVEPEGAAVLAGQPLTRTNHPIQGASYGQAPPHWQPKLCDGYVQVSDAEVFQTARTLACSEGLLVGPSAAANVAAAVRIGRRMGRRTIIVTILCDAGWEHFRADGLGKPG